MKIKHIAIYGSGLIGGGWATHLLIKGITNITMFDINEPSLQKGVNILKKNLDFLVEEGIINESQKEEYIKSIRLTTDVKTAVAEADLIIENGPEILSVKQEIIRTIETVCREDAIITSSTSGIFISAIASGAKHPERILGVHPYHPVYLMPLLEVSKMECTREDVLASCMDFFEAIDKKPVVLMKESDGYIGSRLMTVLLRESVNLVLSGVCTMEDVDNAFTYGPGMRYALFGIFTTLQLTGGDGGIGGLFKGPLGKSTDKWIGSFANWDHWPDEAWTFFDQTQDEMNQMLSRRDRHHGRNNDELMEFRDKGLVRILQTHEMI